MAKNGNTEKPPVTPLPPSLRAALPAAMRLVMSAALIKDITEDLRKEMEAARRQGATSLARAYVVFKRAVERLADDVKPLDALFASYKDELVPETLDAEGVTNVPLAEGFRVGTSLVFRASIKKDMKEQAYEWLRNNAHADIIVESINSSTLSATAGELLKDHCLELPSEFFTVAIMSNTSVTATK